MMNSKNNPAAQGMAAAKREGWSELDAAIYDAGGPSPKDNRPGAAELRAQIARQLKGGK